MTTGASTGWIDVTVATTDVRIVPNAVTGWKDETVQIARTGLTVPNAEIGRSVRCE